jgi:hypothetical protein
MSFGRDAMSGLQQDWMEEKIDLPVHHSDNLSFTHNLSRTRTKIQYPSDWRVDTRVVLIRLNGSRDNICSAIPFGINVTEKSIMISDLWWLQTQ